MADMTEHQKAIAWLWVVEGLATMEQVDVSLLLDLLGELGSALHDHMTKNTRERVALRCLEEIFKPLLLSNGTMNSIHVSSKISFDLSQSCQSVLKRIVDETPESDLRNSGPGLLKWDVQGFILQKKAELPKCALKQLKESFLDGTHSHADFLREKSGFRSDGDTVPVSESNQSVSVSVSSTQDVVIEGNSHCMTIENESRLLKEGKNDENLLLTKSNRTGSDDEKHDRVNRFDDFHKEVKKRKLGDDCVTQSTEQNHTPLHRRDHVQRMSERDVPASVVDGCNLVESQMAMEENRVLEEYHNDFAASMSHGQSSYDPIHKSQRENHSKVTSLPQDPFQDEGHQYSCVGEAGKDDRITPDLRVSDVATPDETQHEVSEQGAHIKVSHPSLTGEPQEASNAGGGSGVDHENMTQKRHISGLDDCYLRSKNIMWNASYVLQSIEQNQLPLYSESSESNVPVSQSVRCDLAVKQTKKMEEDRVLQDSQDDYAESKRSGQSTIEAIHKSQLNNFHNTTSVLQDVTCQSTCVDDTKDDYVPQLELRVSGGAIREESQHKVSSTVYNDNTDSDLHIELPCPATTNGPQWKCIADKGKDPNKYCSESRTSGVAFADETQLKYSSKKSGCVKEHDCQSKVAYPTFISKSKHKSVAGNSKELMDFHCESETFNIDGFQDEKVDAAMKKYAFWRSQCTSSDNSLAITVTEKKISMECDEGGQLLTCATSNCPVVVKKKWLHSLGTFCEKGNFYCPFCSYSLALTDYLESAKKTSQLEEDLNAFVHATTINPPNEPFRTVHVPVGEKIRGEKVIRDCRPVANLDKFQKQVPVEVDHISSKNTQSLLVYQGQAAPVTEQDLKQRITHDSKKPVHDLRFDSVQMFEDHDKRFNTLIYSLRPKSLSSCTQQATTQSRRKKIPWTVEEEEMLKKGVQQLLCTDETRIRWKQVLEYGSDVFLSARTPTDLKDKWRNICRAK